MRTEDYPFHAISLETELLVIWRNEGLMQINSISAYGRVSKTLHWISAGLISIMIALGFYMTSLSSSSAVKVEQKLFLYSMHKTLGVMTLTFIILRVFWSLLNKKPGGLSKHSLLERLAATTVHSTLYTGMLLIPLSGLIHHSASPGFASIWWPFGQSLPFINSNQSLALLSSNIHLYATWAFVLVLGIHISGVIKHVIFDRDETLKRMLSGKGNYSTTNAPPVARYLGLSAQSIFILSIFSISFFSVSRDLNKPSFNQVDLVGQASKQANWKVTYPNSNLAIGVILGDNTSVGVFKSWSASIFFDEKNLEQSWVIVTVNTGSLELETLSQQAISPDFLNSETYPTAIFKAENFLRTSQGNYVAEGQLTLGEVSRSFSLPFSLTIDGNNASMKSKTMMNRLDYNIGATGFGNETYVKFAVSIEVNLLASKPQN